MSQEAKTVADILAGKKPPPHPGMAEARAYQAAMCAEVSALLAGRKGRIAQMDDSRGEVTQPGYWAQELLFVPLMAPRNSGISIAYAPMAGPWSSVWGKDRHRALDGRMRDALNAAKRLLEDQGWLVQLMQASTQAYPAKHNPFLAVHRSPQQKGV